LCSRLPHHCRRGRRARALEGCVSLLSSFISFHLLYIYFAGALPNITRNAIVNATELVSYDLIKEAIISHKLLSDNMPCHFVSAFCAGFCTTVIASPVDVVKTRFMNAPVGVYKGAVHCATTMFREGGMQAFYKG
jgi:solute carrier family 25 uncoupling protein 8/9